MPTSVNTSTTWSKIIWIPSISIHHWLGHIYAVTQMSIFTIGPQQTMGAFSFHIHPTTLSWVTPVCVMPISICTISPIRNLIIVCCHCIVAVEWMNLHQSIIILLWFRFSLNSVKLENVVWVLVHWWWYWRSRCGRVWVSWKAITWNRMQICWWERREIDKSTQTVGRHATAESGAL